MKSQRPFIDSRMHFECHIEEFTTMYLRLVIAEQGYQFYTDTNEVVRFNRCESRIPNKQTNITEIQIVRSRNQWYFGPLPNRIQSIEHFTGSTTKHTFPACKIVNIFTGNFIFCTHAHTHTHIQSFHSHYRRHRQHGNGNIHKCFCLIGYRSKQLHNVHMRAIVAAFVFIVVVGLFATISFIDRWVCVSVFFTYIFF